MKINLLSLCFIFFSTLFLCNGAEAIPIITETIITGDTSIINSGTLVEANNLGSSAQSSSVNGVNFGTDSSSLSGWDLGTGDFSSDPFSRQLDTLLSTASVERSASSGSLTLDSLTVGTGYRLQLLFSNDLSEVGNNVYVNFMGEQYALNDWQDSAVNLSINFLATDTIATISFDPGLNATVFTGLAVMNAYALHEASYPTPEPGSIFLLALGITSLLGLRRKRR